MISIESNTRKTKVNILKSSCCCDHYSDLIEISINNESEIQKNTILFHSNTEIEVSNTIYRKNLSGILRSTATIEDAVKKDPCTDDKIIGNQIGTLKNEKVVVLSEIKDWFLVLIKQNNVSAKIGWIHK